MPRQPVDTARLTTKEAVPASLSQGLFLDGRRQMVFNSLHVKRYFQTAKPTNERVSRAQMP
jgi:hypothetical protein